MTYTPDYHLIYHNDHLIYHNDHLIYHNDHFIYHISYHISYIISWSFHISYIISWSFHLRRISSRVWSSPGKRVVSQSMVSDDDEEEEDDDDDTWWGWGWFRLVNILKMSRELPSTYPLFHLIISLLTHLSIDHHIHPSINTFIHLPHPLIYDYELSKTLSSMLINVFIYVGLTTVCMHLAVEERVVGRWTKRMVASLSPHRWLSMCCWDMPMNTWRIHWSNWYANDDGCFWLSWWLMSLW